MSEQSESHGTSESDCSANAGDENRPNTFKDLFRFYYVKFKPLYSLVSSQNVVPTALLLEAVAAFDHLSRHWEYGEKESTAVDRAAGHLKRATFDAYKLVLKETRKEYERLCRVDTSGIDNGDFDRNYLTLWKRIRAGAVNARTWEGNAIDDWHRAFELWDAVFQDCERFRNEFVYNPKVNRARYRGWIRLGAYWACTIIISLICSLVAGFIVYATTK